jgi:hypothetical protein
MLEKTRFQGIKVYFCLKNAKKKETGQPGITFENIEKPLIHFASPRKTIELFEKALPFPENH